MRAVVCKEAELEVAGVMSEIGCYDFTRCEHEVVSGHEFTGTAGLGGVEAAFDALGDPETHAEILIDPRSMGTDVQGRQTYGPIRSDRTTQEERP
jgi:hypothetical protein